MSYKIKDWNLY